MTLRSARPQLRQDLVLYAVGEIGVLFFIAQIFEWKHRDAFVDLFLAKFLEGGIGAQGIPDRIEPKKGRRNGRGA